jgi:hypothetical protein
MRHCLAQQIGEIRVKKAILVPLTSLGGLSGTVSGTCAARASARRWPRRGKLRDHRRQEHDHPPHLRLHAAGTTEGGRRGPLIRPVARSGPIVTKTVTSMPGHQDCHQHARAETKRRFLLSEQNPINTGVSSDVPEEGLEPSQRISVKLACIA